MKRSGDELKLMLREGQKKKKHAVLPRRRNAGAGRRVTLRNERASLLKRNVCAELQRKPRQNAAAAKPMLRKRKQRDNDS